MIDMIVEKAKGLLLNPVETFQKSRSDAIEPTVKYFAVIVLIHAILSLVVAFILTATGSYAIFEVMVKQLGLVVMPLMGIVGAVIFVIIVEFLALFFAFVLGGWLHIWVYLLGGKKGYVQTVKALMLGSTPSMLIGWIPIIGTVIGGIWSFILAILGVRELQEISTGRAIAAIVIAGIIVAAVACLFALLFILALINSATPFPLTGMG
ncbi:MAG: YIP1 family protein [Methanoregulaceae archaeon]